VIDNQELLKISGNYCFLGDIGGEVPQGIKMGIFKPKAYF
jgi:hypothetical protein